MRSPLHPLLPPLPELAPMTREELERENLLRRLFNQPLLQMASGHPLGCIYWKVEGTDCNCGALLPALPEAETFDWDTYWERKAAMASDGQVEEKPEKRGPSPIETMREFEHLPPRQGKCHRTGEKTYQPVQSIPEPCDNCGDDYISRGIVERDVETGDIYRRDGKAVPREPR